MNYDSLQRSPDASQAYYARIFTPIQPSCEQIRFEQKQIISSLYREALDMESRLRAIRQAFGQFINAVKIEEWRARRDSNSRPTA